MKKFFLTIAVALILTSVFPYVNPDYESPIVNVVEACAPAVVKIDVVKTVKTSFFDPYFEQFFKKWFGELPPGFERQVASLGSGFIFDPEGYILTNYHVVGGADNITVTMLDGSKYDAEYIGGDEELDIAVIKIKASDKKFPYLEFGDSDKVKIGEWAIAIGNPLGFQHTVTVGVVSATNRRIPKPDGSGYYVGLIQTDAAINPGNSGGPLLNIHGEVIGINTAIVNPQEAVNLGFAIPINTVKKFLDTILTQKKVEKAYLGVTVMTLTEETAKALGLESTSGALITSVQKGSPAEKAGLKEGDVILKVDDQDVRSHEELVSIIHTYKPGDTAVLTIERKGKIMKVQVTFGSSSEEEKTTTGEEKIDALGITVSNITPADRETYSIPEEINGVIVKESTGKFGLQKGDVITTVYVNGKRYDINSVGDLKKVTSIVKNGDYIALYIYRNGAKVFVSFIYQR
ncbi:serine protease [Thermotoga maritima MSB8]|uniref:Heat shock serine protease, periplasmic n=2 Tax=Thermotoga TaxID=2335 RepID=Q9WZ41_THEMA|nr:MULTISPECIES: DegQ family serine endoprotease [Thermotoga]AAD35656.1 heat shock serine protease, periplasmic [Thermotoga maritima MSB8]ADA66455.1 protease Do [Thermotoga petrophila RKU-10]AGL49494.1 HtrA protease/chaperone protein [Thermotoga maritima MSB8]AHD17672.1 serine protease [Thermotoga maritima MSB8]AKE26493.1 serine protease [Thermotoga maritima]